MLEDFIRRWDMLSASPGPELIVAALVFALALLLVKPAALPGGRGAWAVRLGAICILTTWTVAALTYVAFWAPAKPNEVLWWGWLSVPIGLAFVALVPLSLRPRARDVRAVDEAPLRRRTWTSFVARRRLWTGSLLMILLVGITVICGRVSRPMPDGRLASYLGIGNTGIGALGLYGWRFGAPVLACSALLVIATIAALHRVASEPLSASSRVAEELQSRAARSSRVVLFAVAAVALPLGSVLRLLGASTSETPLAVLTVGGSDQQFPAGTMLDPFAWPLFWGGALLQVFALVAMFAVAANHLPSLRAFRLRLHAGRTLVGSPS